jgi:prevent-host-death family protein
MKTTYGLEQARAQLPHIAAEAHAGYSSVITRHGKPVAAVVPVSVLQAEQTSRVRRAGILALRGTGRSVWPAGASTVVADLFAPQYNPHRPDPSCKHE